MRGTLIGGGLMLVSVTPWEVLEDVDLTAPGPSFTDYHQYLLQQFQRPPAQVTFLEEE